METAIATMMKPTKYVAVAMPTYVPEIVEEH